MSLSGHTSVATSVAFIPSTQRIVSGSSDTTLRVWDTRVERCLRVLQGHAYPINGVSVSTRGDYIASGSSDDTIRLWDSHSGGCFAILHGHMSWVTSVSFSPDSTRLISASSNCTLRIWDLQTITEASGRATNGHSSAVCCMTFSPKRPELASCLRDGTIHVWGPMPQRLHNASGGVALDGPIDCVRSSPDGRFIASSSWDHTVRTWDAESGILLSTMHGHQDWVVSLDISPDGKHIASVSRDGFLRLWDVASGEAVGNDVRSAFIGEAQRPFASFAYSPSGRLIATTSADGLIRLWNPVTLALLKTFSGHTDDATAVAFFHRSEKLVSCSVDTSLRIWDIRDGKLLKVLDGHWDRVVDVAISPQDDYIASASCDFSFRLWDAQSSTPLAVLIPDAYRERCFTVAFTCDGSKLVTGGYDCTVRTWDFKNVKPGLELENSFLQVSCVAFTEDGSHLFAACNDREFAISKVMNHTLIRPTPHVCCANAVTSHSNNDELRATRIGQMEAYRTARWTRGVVRCAASSSDCRILATGCSTHIGLWSLEDLNLVMEIEHNLKWRRM
ncbi:WD40 repeat-like protein, partial [Wolfiporia cocos MD-104 SS10]